MRRPLILSALAAVAVCDAQYPPGQYAGSVSAGRYPNAYPTCLPGGIPVNLPVPDLKLTKKGSKEGGKSAGVDDKRNAREENSDGYDAESTFGRSHHY